MSNASLALPSRLAMPTVVRDPRTLYAPLGVRLAVLVVVISQFVEVDLISSIGLTLQKLLGLSIMPYALFLMRRVHMHMALLGVMLTMLLAFCMRDLLQAQLTTEAQVGIATVLIGFFGAVALYTACRISPRAINHLSQVWVLFAIVSSPLAVAQMTGITSFRTPVADSFKSATAYDAPLTDMDRGIGFRADPNFLALSLVVAIAFLQAYRPRYWVLSSTVIAMGIMGTCSRMGIIIALLLLVAGPLLRAWALKEPILAALPRQLATVVLLALAAIAFTYFGPYSGREYCEKRFEEIVEVLDGSYDAGESHGRKTSAGTRWDLLKGALVVTADHWATGVGAYRTVEAIAVQSGDANVAHNTFIELLVIGGMWGALPIVIYTHSVVASINQRLDSTTDRLELAACLLVTGAVAGCATFLSLSYNSMFWFPLVLVLSRTFPDRGRSNAQPSAQTRERFSMGRLPEATDVSHAGEVEVAPC